MIVPPGVPLIFTILLGNVRAIIIVQYVLFGFSAAFLAKSAGFFSKTGFYLAPVLFLLACFYIGESNPSELLTENYTMFLLSLSLYLFLRPDRSTAWKVSLLLPVQFLAFLIRPVVGGLLALAFVGMAVLVARKQIPLRRLVVYSAVFVAALALNTYVNYRETGYYVILEDYGAIPAYQANNPNTKTTGYNSSLSSEFTDSYFQEVYGNPNLDLYQKNALLKQRTAEFVKENLLFVLKNSAIKYARLYIVHYWGYSSFLLLFFTFVIFWRQSRYAYNEMPAGGGQLSATQKQYGVSPTQDWRLSPASILVLAAAFFLVTIVPVFGLFILRYSIPCVPFYAVFNGIFYGLVIESIWHRHIPSESEKTVPCK